MKCFLDCEFTGLHQHTTLISIGLVSEDGRKFYAESTEYDGAQIDAWLLENVIKHLYLESTSSDLPTMTGGGDLWTIIGKNYQIAILLKDWLKQFDKVEMWSDCLAYDWVLFCDLFGEAMQIPENVYYIPFDICTVMKIRGVDPDVNREEFAGVDGNKHNALHDAIVIMECYNKIMKP